MSIIQRPGKEGNATTYQGKVAAGYTKILAAEVDADIDTIYSAWNAGVDTVNIRDGSITGPKLAVGAVGSRELADSGVQTVDLADGAVTDAKISGVAFSKLTGGAVAGIVPLNPRVSVNAAASYGELQLNHPSTTGFDNSKPTWLIRGDYTGDAFQVWRAPAPGSAFVAVLQVDTNGLVTHKAYGGGALMAAPQGPLAAGGHVALPLTVAWNDDGNLFDAGVGGLHAPPFDCWVAINGVASVSANGGFGVSLNIEQNTGGPSTYTTIATVHDTLTAQGLSTSTIKPVTANSKFRLSIDNGTGANLTITAAQMTMTIVGKT